MPVTERVMALGDWSLNLRDDTPLSVRQSIATPFGQLVVTSARFSAANVNWSTILANALWTGVTLRPGPQFELGGVGLAWYLGDDRGGGPGYVHSGFTVAAGSVGTAVSTILTGSGISSGTISAGTVEDWLTGPITRREALGGLIRQLGFEWRILPNFVLDMGTASTLYGATPTGVIVRRVGPREVATPYGVVGSVDSTWDYEQYASKTYVFANTGIGSSGGASTYRDALGNIMTISNVYEVSDAPAGAENAVADWWLGQVNRPVRTVTATSIEYAITGKVAVGASVWIHDVDLGLYDTANQIVHGGRVLSPVQARVMAATFPIERGMGVFMAYHDGTNRTVVDLSDWVEWESPGVRLEVSTSAQTLAPPNTTPLADLWRPWSSYDAVWDQTASSPTLGNGSVNCRYRRLGTAVEISGTIRIGSTTTLGAGNFAVSMPPGCTAKSITQGRQTGTWSAEQAGVDYYSGICWVDSSVSSGNSIYFGTGGTPVAPVRYTAAGSDWSPFEWGSGDAFTFSLRCEVEP